MSRVIPSEELDDCQAWHVPEVEGGAGGQRPLTARQLEAIQDQARREGFEQGLAEGRAAGQDEFSSRVALLEQLLGAFANPFEELDEGVEQQLAQLAMLVARQLVRRELKTDPGQVIAVVRAALAELPLASRDIRLALHPDDIGLVREALSMGEDEQRIHIVEDPVQSRGGCRIETDTSQIDASVESRLNAIIAQVLGGERQTDPRDEHDS
ncbi:MAG TPA: flagellar assembly protein FliH [Gammaproteobacteria bacterium]|nr:flagellar assembly protein FliH [Gammaproteobacteria bacterium]